MGVGGGVFESAEDFAHHGAGFAEGLGVEGFQGDADGGRGNGFEVGFELVPLGLLFFGLGAELLGGRGGFGAFFAGVEQVVEDALVGTEPLEGGHGDEEIGDLVGGELAAAFLDAFEVFEVGEHVGGHGGFFQRSDGGAGFATLFEDGGGDVGLALGDDGGRGLGAVDESAGTDAEAEHEGGGDGGGDECVPQFPMGLGVGIGLHLLRLDVFRGGVVSGRVDLRGF